jgi:hypothetical protein
MQTVRFVYTVDRILQEEKFRALQHPLVPVQFKCYRTVSEFCTARKCGQKCVTLTAFEEITLRNIGETGHAD